MDLHNMVEAIVVGVLIAKFIGFIGARMYEVLLIITQGMAVVVIGGLGWLGVIVAGAVAIKLLYPH